MSQHDAKRLKESQDFTNLVSLMYKKCAQEIVDHIKYWTFELVFCPGHILCNRYPEEEACGWPKTSPGRPTLLALSKGIQTNPEPNMEKYSEVKARFHGSRSRHGLGRKYPTTSRTDLELEELTLHFTECYDSNGYWMDGVVADNLSWIRKKFPGILQVLGPDEQKQKALIARILGLAETGLLSIG
ncbi:MAG: hypothetical protein Q9226_005561 [Calogaya cf. arnoldii]